MLWLAGLLGIIGVSAASFMIYQPQEEADDDALDDDALDAAGQDDLLAPFGMDHHEVGAEGVLGLDDMGNPFSLSPHANGTNDPEYPLNKEDYLFGQSLEDDIYSELARPILPDADDVPAPLDVLGQDKHLFVDQLPIDKPPLFPEQGESADIYGHSQNPLSGALGKDALNKITPAPQSDMFEPGGAQMKTEAAHDLFILEQDMITSTASVMFNNWMPQGNAGQVLDYDAGQDSLVVVWDDLANGAKEPSIDVVNDPFDDAVQHVLMNGQSLAQVYGDPNLDASDVSLIPLSSALALGLEPA